MKWLRNCHDILSLVENVVTLRSYLIKLMTRKAFINFVAILYYNLLRIHDVKLSKMNLNVIMIYITALVW
jgi:hypothetical protein